MIKIRRPLFGEQILWERYRELGEKIITTQNIFKKLKIWRAREIKTKKMLFEILNLDLNSSKNIYKYSRIFKNRSKF